MGLALDSVYPRELEGMRRAGRGLLEVGMLADRRRCASRGMKALFSMMRWAVHFGLQNDLTDVVIGVHPHHAPLYIRCYGFEQFGDETSYPLVRNHPVVGLRLRLREGLAKDVLPRGLADARDNPVPSSAFANRFRFEPAQLGGSVIANYLKARYGIELDGVSDWTRTAAVAADRSRILDKPRLSLPVLGFPRAAWATAS
jgi:hypothetical protein